MHTHLWEISSADKMNTYWFLGFFSPFFLHYCELNMYLKDYFSQESRTVSFEDEIMLNFMNINQETG